MEHIRSRDGSIDFVKSVMIVLMVLFHVAYFADKHLFVKQVVYTFHMPVFLILSGYLLPIERAAGRFFRNQAFIFLPYALLESAYTCLSAILPVRERVEHLTFAVVMDRVWLHPLGPYWYLHTLMLCAATAWCAYHGLRGRRLLWLPVLVGAYLLLSEGLGLVSLANAFYFLAGLAIRAFGLPLQRVFVPQPWSIILFAALLFFFPHANRSTPAGVGMVFCMTAFCFWLSQHIPFQRYWQFLGMNTLPVLLFSPIFTMTAKPLISLFSADPSGLAFGLFTTALALVGSMALGLLADKLRLSPLIFGKKQLIQPIS